MKREFKISFARVLAFLLGLALFPISLFAGEAQYSNPPQPNAIPTIDANHQKISEPQQPSSKALPSMEDLDRPLQASNEQVFGPEVTLYSDEKTGRVLVMNLDGEAVAGNTDSYSAGARMIIPRGGDSVRVMKGESGKISVIIERKDSIITRVYDPSPGAAKHFSSTAEKRTVQELEPEPKREIKKEVEEQSPTTGLKTDVSSDKYFEEMTASSEKPETSEPAEIGSNAPEQKNAVPAPDMSNVPTIEEIKKSINDIKESLNNLTPLPVKFVEEPAENNLNKESEPLKAEEKPERSPAAEKLQEKANPEAERISAMTAEIEKLSPALSAPDTAEAAPKTETLDMPREVKPAEERGRKKERTEKKNQAAPAEEVKQDTQAEPEQASSDENEKSRQVMTFDARDVELYIDQDNGLASLVYQGLVVAGNTWDIPQVDPVHAGKDFQFRVKEFAKKKLVIEVLGPKNEVVNKYTLSPKAGSRKDKDERDPFS